MAIEPEAGGFRPIQNFLADESAQLAGMGGQDYWSLGFFQPLRMGGQQIECAGIQDHRHIGDGEQSRKKISESLGGWQARANDEGLGLVLKGLQVWRGSIGMGRQKQFR